MPSVTYVPSRIGEGFFTDVPIPVSGDNGKALTYNHATGKYIYTAFEASGAVAAHVGLSDPHTQYLLKSGVSAFGATLIDDADAATARATLGLGTIATATETGYLLADGSRAGATGSRQSFANGVSIPSTRPLSDSTTAYQIQNVAGTSIVNVDSTNKYVGVNTVAPTSALDIGGANTLYLTISPSTTSYTTNDILGGIQIKTQDGSVGSTGVAHAMRVISENSNGSILSTVFTVADGTYGRDHEILRLVGTGEVKIRHASDPKLIISEGGSSTSYMEFADLTPNVFTMKKYTDSGVSSIDIDPIPSDGISDAAFRFFRTTSTVGSVYFDIFKGNGMANANARISGNGHTYFAIDNGSVGIGTNTPVALLDTAASTTSRASLRIRPGTDPTTPNDGDIWKNTDEFVMYAAGSNTNTILNTLRLRRNSSGTPAAGFGSALNFQMKSSTTAGQDAGRIYSLWNVATHASRAADMVHTTFYTSTEQEFIRGRGDTSGVQLGFYGVTPVARQLLATGAGATVDDVITALQNLGLVKQS